MKFSQYQREQFKNLSGKQRKAFLESVRRRQRRKCHCLMGCVKCGCHPMIIPKEMVERMYGDYERGLSFSAIGRLYPLKNGRARGHSEVRNMFKRRGLAVRPVGHSHLRNVGNNGCFVSITPPTEKEITEMIRSATKIVVPEPLKLFWRKWSMAQRARFLERLRARINSPQDRPTTPFSSNVEPFDYTSQRAQAIQRKSNASLDSHQWRVKIKLKTQGVIYGDELYYWFHNTGYVSSGWSPEKGRPILHHIIWEQHNVRKVPDKFTVIFKDGNKNNLAPVNLTLRSMADCARQNQIFNRLKSDPENPRLKETRDRMTLGLVRRHAAKSRNRTNIILNRFNKKEPNAVNDTIHNLKRQVVAH